MRYLKSLFLLLVLISTPAWASNEPIKAPSPDWIKAVPLPKPDPSRADALFQPLLMSSQTRYGKDGTDYYVEWAMLIQQPQGLAAAGNIVLPWQPDRSDLIVHKVEIVRDGKAEDILAKGQEFTVLRRENNLESAMLDGVLTAVLQPEGLKVGDIVHVAFTIRMKPDTLGLRAENLVTLLPGVRTRRAFFRELWPDDMDMRWRATDAIGKPVVRKTRSGTELVLDLADAEGPTPPASAPARYALPAMLQVTEYHDWGEISRLFAPLYAKAESIDPSSPLRQEISRIAQSSPDPLKRAMAALRLVQDNIRYLALAMGDGGYVPASADQTWSRKFGDCKGKTALLLALLHGLGIEAEPVLVSSTAGDGLNERLPQVRLFDHVIVQARIGGKSYWLDGTRTGDRRIEELASSPFRWGLPVESAGASLEQLPLLPPSLPLIETKITYDASKGFLAPVPVTGEMVYRGDLATLFRMGLAQLGQDEFKKKAHELVQNLPVDEHAQLDFKADEELGTFTVSFEGMQQMDWAGGPGGKRVLFRFGDDTIQWTPDFKREDGPLKDVPFALPFPTYLAYTETVILPHGGAGFTLEGKDLDRTIAGTHISRTLSLANGQATAHSIFERLKPEISAAEAHAAEPVLQDINSDVAGVRSPADYQFSDEEKRRLLETEPTSAEGYNGRGYEFLQQFEFGKALADFDKAASMAPQWSRPLSNRAIVLLHQDKLDEAEAALKKAALLSDDDFVTPQGYGLLYAARDKPVESVAAFTKSLRLEPDNEFDLFNRASQYEALGQYREALADIERILSNNPENGAAFREGARLHAVLNEPDAAIGAIDKAIALNPDDVSLKGYRGELLARFGRRAEANESFAEAIKLFDEQHPIVDDFDLRSQKISLLSLSGQHDAAIASATAGLAKQSDNVRMLISRCDARASAMKDLEKGLQDCSHALEYSDGNVQAAVTKGIIELKMARWKDALADFDQALTWIPHNPRALYGRGLAKLRMGDKEGGEKDLAAARRYGFDTFAEYEEIGLKP